MSSDNDEGGGALVAFGIYMYIMYLFFVFVYPVIVISGSAILLACFIFLYSKAIYEFIKNKIPDTKLKVLSKSEPAYLNYYFSQAYSDLKAIIKRGYQSNHDLVVHVHNKATIFWAGAGRMVFTWPLAVAYFSVLIVSILAAGAGFSALALLHITIVGTRCLTIYISAGFLRSLEYLNMLLHGMFFVCSSCYHRFSFPIYICDNCHAEHHSLLPGPCGIWKRECQCGHLLPTTLFHERNKLTSLCPNCKHVLSGREGLEINKHIAIAGSSSSGKSCYIFSSLWMFLEKFAIANDIKHEFVDPKDKDKYDQSVALFKSGQEMLKTTDEKHEAFRISCKTMGNIKKYLLYIYDAAGEIFLEEDRLADHVFHDYAHGIVFIIDVFAIDTYKHSYDEVTLTQKIRPADVDNKEIFARLCGFLEKIQKTKAGQKFKTPLAVVVNKIDACDAPELITQSDKIFENFEDKNTLQDFVLRHNDKTRQKLIEWDLGNLIKTIESRFSHFSYFACSSLGRIPDPEKQEMYTPVQVLDPFVWLLLQSNVKFFPTELDNKVSSLQKILETKSQVSN